MKLDYAKIINEAKKYRISPHLLAKRNLNYKLSRNKKNCGNCKFITMLQFQESSNFTDVPATRIQCEMIGEGKDFHADVGKNCVCDNFEEKENG